MRQKKALFTTVGGFVFLLCCLWGYRSVYDSTTEIKSPPFLLSKALITDRTKHSSQEKESFWKRYENKTIIILGTEYNYIPLLLNHVLSLRSFAEYEVLVETYDQKAHHFFKGLGFPVFSDEFSELVADQLFSLLNCTNGSRTSRKDQTEKKIMYMRLELHKAHLSRGLPSLSLDVDTCWLKSPDVILKDSSANFLFALQKGKSPLPGFSYNWIKDDTNFYRFNPGIAYLRPSEAFMEIYAKVYGDAMNHLCDQGYLQGSVGRQLWESGLRMSEVNGQLEGKVSGVVVKTIPYAMYASACESQESKKVTKETLLVHANCQGTISKKVGYLKSSGCWYLKDDWKQLAKHGLSLSKYLDAIDIRKNR